MNDFARVALMGLVMSPSFWFVARIHRTLAQRHPTTWATLGRGRDVRALMLFLWAGRHRLLDDADLNLKVLQYRWAMALGLVAIFVIAAVTSRA